MNYGFNDGKMFMDMADGIALVINSRTGIYYGMNEFGTMVFDALVKGVSDGDVKAALKSMKGAPSDMESKVDAFIGELKNLEIIIPGEGSGDYAFDEKIAAENDFLLEVEAYDDAQEMLLADPIHEVKEETGWTPEKASIGYSKEETREREKKLEG